MTRFEIIPKGLFKKKVIAIGKKYVIGKTNTDEQRLLIIDDAGNHVLSYPYQDIKYINMSHVTHGLL